MSICTQLTRSRARSETLRGTIATNSLVGLDQIQDKKPHSASGGAPGRFKSSKFTCFAMVLLVLALYTQPSAAEPKPGADTVVVYVIDLSGSASNYANCGTLGLSRYINHGLVNCEIAAILSLNEQIIENSNVGEVGLVAFADTAWAADMAYDVGHQLRTEPDSLYPYGPYTNLEWVVRSVAVMPGRIYQHAYQQVGNSTNFSAAMIEAARIANDSPMPNKMVVFFTDGQANIGQSISYALETISQSGSVPAFHAFPVGTLAGCTTVTYRAGASLQDLADDTGGTCTHVTNPDNLPAISLPHTSRVIAERVYLGSLGNGSYGVDINLHNQVLGYSIGPSFERYAYIFSEDPGTNPVALGVEPGFMEFVPNAINDAGQVVGTTQNPYSQPRGIHATIVTPNDSNNDGIADIWFLDSNNDQMNDLMQTIPTLGGPENSAIHVNNQGVVVGVSDTSSYNEAHAFLWSPSMGTLDLGTLGGPRSFARQIQNDGVVTGGSFDFLGIERYFRIVPLDTNADGMPDTWFQDANTDGANDLMTAITNLQLPADADSAFVQVWNMKGQLAGATTNEATDNIKAAIWSETGAVTTSEVLDSLGVSGQDSWVQDLNNLGIATGSMHIINSQAPAPFGLPYILSPQLGFQNLGGLSHSTGFGMAINDVGDRVAGISPTSSGEPQAAVWKVSNTALGFSRAVDPETGVSLTFSQVDTVGLTQVVTSTVNPGPALTDFTFNGLFYDVVTTSDFSGTVEICFPHPFSKFGGRPRLQHLVNGVWEDVPTYRKDRVADFVCATVTSFSWFAVATDEEAPTVDAGPDRTVACTNPSGAVIVLDGSGSNHPQGLDLSFQWTGPFGSASGVQPSVDLPLGLSTSSLIVSDGEKSSLADSVMIKVVAEVSGLTAPLEQLVPSEGEVNVPKFAFKQGRTLPLKLALNCGLHVLTDADVTPPNIVSVYRVEGETSLDVQDIDAGAANDNDSLFRYANGQWVYNLSTKPLIPGQYVVTIKMPDGELYDGGFALR